MGLREEAEEKFLLIFDKHFYAIYIPGRFKNHLFKDLKISMKDWNNLKVKLFKAKVHQNFNTNKC